MNSSAFFPERGLNLRGIQGPAQEGREGDRVGDKEGNGDSGDKMCGETEVEMESACPQRAVLPGREGQWLWEF